MSFNFGENLRSLRKQKGLTQEQTAELLNVSKQSVSRWENNSTWPDIMFLPVLASFFGVTVDAILGADYETNKSLIDAYEAERQEAHHRGDIAAAFGLTQKLYGAFPNHSTVINNMMHDACLMGLCGEENRRKSYLELSVSVAERFLKLTDDVEEQSRCIRHISLCSRKLGNQDEALRWLMKLPSIWSSIEFAAVEVMEGRDRTASAQCAMDAGLQLLYRMILLRARDGELSRNERIKALEKVPAILETLFEEGDYGYYHAFLSESYAELAKLSAADRATAGHYAEKAVMHAQRYDNLAEGEHRSLLFRDHAITPAAYTKTGTQSRREAVESELSDIFAQEED